MVLTEDVLELNRAMNNGLVEIISTEKFLGLMTDEGEACNKASINYDFSGLVDANAKKNRTTAEKAVCWILTKAAEQLCPSLKFVYTAKGKNADVDDDLRPATACYATDTTVSNDPATDWADIEMLVHVLDDDKAGNSAWKAHRLLMTYARFQALRQHRSVVFSIGIYGNFENTDVQLFRWDRAGGVYCELDVARRRGGRALAAFLTRYAALGRAARGWDDAAAVASPAERELLVRAVADRLARVRRREEPLVPYLHETLDTRWPTYRLRLPGAPLAVIGGACELVVRRPARQLYTWGYVAYHLGEKRLVWLKDYWVRYDPADRGTEGAIINKLRDAQVPHLPRVLYATGYDDAPCRTTVSQDYLIDRDDWVFQHRARTVPRHHVQVVEELLYPVTFARDSRHLVQVFRDVFETLDKAHHNAHILHRDINTDRIMLTAEGEGILCGWKYACESTSPQLVSLPIRQYCIPYICDRIHLDDTHWSYKHDLESCFWAFIYSVEFGVVKTRMPYPGALLQTFMKQRYKAFLERPSEHPLEFSCAPLTGLVRCLRWFWGAYYGDVVSDRVTCCSLAAAEDHEEDEDEPTDGRPLSFAKRLLLMFDVALAEGGWPAAGADGEYHRAFRTDGTDRPRELEACAGTPEQLVLMQADQVDRTYFVLLPVEKAGARKGAAAKRKREEEEQKGAPMGDGGEQEQEQDGEPVAKLRRSTRRSGRNCFVQQAQNRKPGDH